MINVQRLLLWICIFNAEILGQICNCGQVDIQVRHKRINPGRDAVQGRFPWHVMIEVQKIGDLEFGTDRIFSGTLISIRHVITCGKCLDDFFESVS